MGKTEDSANAFQHMHIVIKIGPCGFERKGICTESAAVRWAHALHLIYTESSVAAELLYTGRIFKQTVSAAIILNAPMDQEVGSLDLPSLAAFLKFYGLNSEERARLSYLDLCFTLADPWLCCRVAAQLEWRRGQRARRWGTCSPERCGASCAQRLTLLRVSFLFSQ